MADSTGSLCVGMSIADQASWLSKTLLLKVNFLTKKFKKNLKKSQGFGRTVAGSFGSWKQSSLFIEHSKSFNIAAV
jgi:hypothetical protein